MAASEVTYLGSAEPNLTFQTGAIAASGPNTISVNVAADGQQIVLVGYSQSGYCWAVSEAYNDERRPAGCPLLMVRSTAAWPETATTACNAASAALPPRAPGSRRWQSTYPANP